MIYGSAGPRLELWSSVALAQILLNAALLIILYVLDVQGAWPVAVYVGK